MKIYLAASSADMPRVRAVIAVLKSHGFAITSTWPDVIAAVGEANPREAAYDDRRGWATTDLNEIDSADALLFLVPTPPVSTRGAWLECGYAYNAGKHLVFAGDTRQSVFCALGAELETDAGAVAHLLALRERLADRFDVSDIDDADEPTIEREPIDVNSDGKTGGDK